MRIALARALAISAVTLASAGPVGAGSNQFTLIGPEGGGIQQVQFHPTNPSIVFALTSAGYYRSTDAGLNWQLVGENLNLQFPPADLAVDPSDPNRVLVGVPGRAPLVSTDAGATLANTGNFPFAPADVRIVEFSADGSVVYGASGVRIVRSTDSGRTWSERTALPGNPASPVQFLRVDPLNSDIVYGLHLAQGGFRSTNGGGTWQPFALPTNTFDIAITATTPQSIWAATALGLNRSTDGGATFPLVFPGGPPRSAVALALDPTNPSVVYVSTEDGVFRTADGNGWDNVTTGTSTGLVTSIAVDPLQPANLMIGGGAGLLAGVPATMGTGGDWQRRERGIRATNALTMSAASGSGRIYVNTAFSGVHFLANGSTATTAVDNDELQALQLSPAQSTTFGLLAQARATDRLFVGVTGGYVRSNDGGDTWGRGSVGGSSNADTVLHFASSPADPDVIVAATTMGLHRSIDGGDTWTPSVSGLPNGAMATVLTFSSATAGTVYAGIESLTTGNCCAQHGVYKSTDGGASWSAANAGFEDSEIRALAVDPTNAQVVYAAASAGGLLKTTNGGASWTQLDWPDGPGNTNAVAIDPDLPGIVYVAGINAFARSVDGGATWQELRASDALPEWRASALLADPQRAATLLVATSTHGVAELTVAPNLVLESPAAPTSPVAPGVAATYRYRLRNAGTFHATGVQTVVTLPNGATSSSATITNGGCVVQGTTVTCTTQVLQAAATTDIVVTSTHPSAGTVQILASVSGDQPDPQTADDSVTYNVSVAQPVTPLPPPPPQSPPPSGGGGGGGTSSLLWLLALAVLRIVRSYASPNRFRISGVGPSNAAIGTLPTYFRSRKPTGVV
jgi:uncharacterized repeat protein (TIGR01451 family)